MAKSLARKPKTSQVLSSCDKISSVVSQQDWSRPVDLQSILLLSPLQRSMESQITRKVDQAEITEKTSFRLRRQSLSQKPSDSSEVLII